MKNFVVQITQRNCVWTARNQWCFSINSYRAFGEGRREWFRTEFLSIFLSILTHTVTFHFSSIISTRRKVISHIWSKKKRNNEIKTSMKLKKERRKRRKKQHLSEKEGSRIAQINSKPPIPRSEQRWNEAANANTSAAQCIHFYIPR